MAEIDAWSDVLPEPQRRLWPAAAKLAAGVGATLMGGTAVAVHLRHRTSEDFDLMTFRTFSGRAVMRRARDLAGHVEVTEAAADCFHGFLDGVKFDIFRALPYEEIGPSQMRRIQLGPLIDGLRIGSIPDLMATKLAVISYRPKLRDYIDIFEMDRTGVCSIEEGLEYFLVRFGYDHVPMALSRTLTLLSQPGVLPPDRAYENLRLQTLAGLRERVPQALSHLAALRNSIKGSGGPAPMTRSGRSASAPHDTGEMCGKEMPRAKTHCVLDSGHSGHCRSTRQH